MTQRSAGRREAMVWMLRSSSSCCCTVAPGLLSKKFLKRCMPSSADTQGKRNGTEQKSAKYRRVSTRKDLDDRVDDVQYEKQRREKMHPDKFCETQTARTTRMPVGIIE